MEKNAKIEEMIKAAEDWRNGRDAREAEALKPYTEDSEECYEARIDFNAKEEAEHPYPFTAGQTKAMTAYSRSMEKGADFFEVEDLPWDYELEDFVDTLRDAGVESIVITDNSTGLMDGIYGLVALGCRMGKLQLVRRANDHRFGSREPEIRRGIVMEIG